MEALTLLVIIPTAYACS